MHVQCGDGTRDGEACSVTGNAILKRALPRLAGSSRLTHVLHRQVLDRRRTGTSAWRLCLGASGSIPPKILKIKYSPWPPVAPGSSASVASSKYRNRRLSSVACGFSKSGYYRNARGMRSASRRSRTTASVVQSPPLSRRTGSTDIYAVRRFPATIRLPTRGSPACAGGRGGQQWFVRTSCPRLADSMGTRAATAAGITVTGEDRSPEPRGNVGTIYC